MPPLSLIALLSCVVWSPALGLTRRALAHAPLMSYPASETSLFLWQGRFLPDNATGAVSFDVEGASISFLVANATFVGLNISSEAAGGARLGVLFNTNFSSEIADPNPSGTAIPNLRVATLLTSRQQSLYTLGGGSQISGEVIAYSVVLLSEWEMIQDAFGSTLSINSVLTDGVVLAAPPRPTRRLVVLGDSLSSGVGCGFNVPAGGGACGAGVPLDDVSATWGYALCASFGAECEIVAGSGITIFADAGYNLPLVFPWALGAMANDAWPAAERVPWDFAAHPADAVLVELGENDCHAVNCTVGSGLANLADAYVSFVANITAAYGGNKALPVFLAIANHEAGQSAAMGLAVPRLQASGFSNVFFLNATAPDVINGTNIDTGCAGHPSAAQQAFSFQRARPAIAKVLGWL